MAIMKFELAASNCEIGVIAGLAFGDGYALVAAQDPAGRASELRPERNTDIRPDRIVIRRAASHRQNLALVELTLAAALRSIVKYSAIVKLFGCGMRMGTLMNYNSMFA